MTAISARARTARRWGGWALVLGAALVFVTVGPAGGQTDGADGSIQGDAGNGAVLYSQQCATCHGASGQGGVIPGDDRRAPPIDGDAVGLSYWDLVLSTGRMPPPEGDPFDNRHRDVVYTPEEIADLLAFAAQELGVEGELPTPELGDPGQGLEVWAANCAQCHGATGAGGVAGAGAWTPTVTEYDPQTIAEAIRVGPFEMPAFDESQITDEEVADVAAFLHEVNEERGTALGLVELNPVFISGFVALMAIVLLASVAWITGKPTWFPDTARTRQDGEDET